MKKSELNLITEFIQNHVSLQRRKALIEDSKYQLRAQYGITEITGIYSNSVDQRQETIDTLTEILECVHAVHEQYTIN